ncbi:hypothetical protein DY885_12590, partial [Vibrio parahaemolyticus]|nr:hypothetical protein [Vibrio parahaemolyticus]
VCFNQCKHNQHLAKLAICAVYMKSDKYKHWEKRLVRKDKGWLSDGHKKIRVRTLGFYMH